MHTRLFGPVITKTAPSGERTIVVQDPLYLWLIGFPYPAGVYILVPAVTWGIGRMVKKRKHKRGEQDATKLPDDN